MTPRWRYFIYGILVGVIMLGLLQFLVGRASLRKTVILLPTPAVTYLDPRSTDANAGKEGKINLNSANADELSSLPGIGLVKAQAIIEFREQYGAFQNVEELLYITGIGESLLAEIVDLIYID